MSEEFDKQLMSIKDAFDTYKLGRQKDESKPDPSGSEKPSAIVEPTKSPEEKLQECIAAKQNGDNMSIEEATAACKGAGSDADEEAPKEQSCVEKKMSEGMDEAAAKAACAGGDAKDHEGGTLEHCIESAKMNGLSQEEAEAKCKQMMSISDSRWRKPYVGVRGNDNQYSQVVGPYVTRGVSKDAKVEYDSKTGLWRKV